MLTAPFRALKAIDAFLLAGFKSIRLPDVGRPGVPTPVLCETCGIVRPRITWAEAEVLGNPRLPRQIACRTKGCHGHAKPLHDLWESP